MLRHLRLQTNDTILGYISQLSWKRSIYSVKLTQIHKVFSLENLFFYATREEILLVTIDRCNDIEEELDFVREFKQTPYLLGVGEEQIMPISGVMAFAERLREVVHEYGMDDPEIRMVVLSGSKKVRNHPLKKEWVKHGVTVFAPLDLMACFTFDTTDYRHLYGHRYFYAMIERYFLEYSYLYDENADVNHGEDDFDFDCYPDLESAEQEYEDELDDEELIDEDEVERIGEIKEIEEKKENDEEKDDETEEKRDCEGKKENETEEKKESEEKKDDGYPSGEIPLGPNVTIRVPVLKPLSNPRDELAKLIGCHEIKERIDALISLSRYNKMVHDMLPNAKPHNLSLHSLFIGKPGTGKTTVCKIYGSLLKEAGVLSKGHVIIANRSTFVGNYWGDEEKMVHELIDIAQGGVLMIDEAYQLNSSNNNDPGKLVIPLFMDILSDESQRDIAVVLCGYKKEMGRLLELNPGLNSRFPNSFEFTDFSFEELLDITLHRVKEYHYKFTRSAWTKYKSVLLTAYQMRDPQTWGNARFIANLLDHIYLRHAQRCVKLKNPNASRLLAITTSDVESIEVPIPKSRVGF